jgi:hypothetical protein
VGDAVWWQLKSGAGGKHDVRLVFPPRTGSVNKAGVAMHVSGDVHYCGKGKITCLWL